MMAPAISGAAVVLAAAFVWYFQPVAPPSASDGAPVTARQVFSVNDEAARAADTAIPAETMPPSADARAGEAAARPTPSAARSPLPGETPSTPMANLMANRQRDSPPQMVEGEREFAAEPVDASWAPGAEADLLAKFAQMAGLRLIDLHAECRSTMCRLQLTQPGGAPPVVGAPRPFNILLDSIGLEPRWMMAIGERGGPMRSAAYLWREGFAPEQKAGQPHETD